LISGPWPEHSPPCGPAHPLTAGRTGRNLRYIERLIQPAAEQKDR
jgi:hypothetical protein